MFRSFRSTSTCQLSCLAEADLRDRIERTVAKAWQKRRRLRTISDEEMSADDRPLSFFRAVEDVKPRDETSIS
jgi:hypothetical protein